MNYFANLEKRFDNYFHTLSHHTVIFTAWAILALALRILVSFKKGNFDFESWEIVSQLAYENKNVYAHTWRYNYGPIWFWVLKCVRMLNIDLRLALACLLSISDIAIAYLLFKRNHFFKSFIFLFSISTIFISGYHQQFDTIAIFMILATVLYFQEKYPLKEIAFFSLKDIAVLSLLIGISLSCKHLFIFFPLWLAFKIQHPIKKVILIILPYSLFFMLFIPYWHEGKNGIIEHVFNYASLDNSPLYRTFFQSEFFDKLYHTLHIYSQKGKYIFFIGMLITGALVRNKNIVESFLIYCCCLLAFSNGWAVQYFIIPLLFVLFYPSYYSFFFYLISSLFILFSHHEYFGSQISQNAFLRIGNKLFERGEWFFVMDFLLLFALIKVIFDYDIMRLLCKINSLIKDSLKMKM